MPPAVIGFSTTAIGQLAAIRQQRASFAADPDPDRLLDWLCAADPDGIVAQIETYIAPWTPRSERGGTGIIKWSRAISLHCNTDIYRLKVAEEIGAWRVFFFMLDLDKPPTRHVAEIVEWKNNDQCYEDITQPHVKRLRLLTTQFKNANRLRLMR